MNAVANAVTKTTSLTTGKMPGPLVQRKCDCGNSASDIQLITVIDEVAPVITFCPASVTVECTADTSSDSHGVATATDTCDTDVTITESDSVDSSPCGNNVIITRTWTATDDCGNSTTCTQTITTQDTTDPEITCPASVTVECTVKWSDLGVPGPGTRTLRATGTAPVDTWTAK